MIATCYNWWSDCVGWNYDATEWKGEFLHLVSISFQHFQRVWEVCQNKAKYAKETVACKMINGEETNTEEFLQEAKVMSTIPQHPNVIRLIGFCRLPVCIVSGKKKQIKKKAKKKK